MGKKNRVKRFSKIYHGRGSKRRNPVVLLFIYISVFVFVATISYLSSMAINSYLRRPHCTKIELLPETAPERINVKGSDALNGSGDFDNSDIVHNEINNKESFSENLTEKRDLFKINGVEVDLKTLASKSAFEKFLKKVKDDGKNAVIVCLKGEDGKLRYESNLKLAEKWRTVSDKNLINFAEVVEKIKEEDLLPIAKMSAFFDQTAPSVENENTFICESSSGGNRVNVFSGGGGFKKGKWLDVTNADVRSYIVGIVIEMANLGFKNILIDNAWFPVFKSKYEIENFENGAYDIDVRAKAFSKFADDLNSSGVKVIFSYPGVVLCDVSLSKSLFGKLDLLNKFKFHAPIFLDENGLKKCEDILIRAASSLVFVPELYSTSKNMNNLLKKFNSYEIDSNLIVRS